VSLIDYYTYFTPIDAPQARARPVLGQVVWAPALHLVTHVDVLAAQRVSSTSHGGATLKHEPHCDTHFGRRTRLDLPVLNLRLGETEELVTHKAKIRPGIVVADAADATSAQEKHPAHHTERRVVVAPIYDVATEDDPKGFSQVMAARVRCLVYRQFFPSGAWEETRKAPRACSLRAGIVRFDRLHFVTPAPPSLRLEPLRVCDEVMSLLHTALWVYLHGTPTAAFTSVRDMMLAELPPEAK